MKGFIDILIDNGYKGYPNNHTDVPCKDPYFYSTYNPLVQWFKKDPSSDEAIVWGLSQSGNPPCLVHPRPKVEVYNEDGSLRFSDVNDKAMVICLDNVDNEHIFKTITTKKDFTYKFKMVNGSVKDITQYA